MDSGPWFISRILRNFLSPVWSRITTGFASRPNETKNILVGALRGIAYTKARREEVLPLLKEFLGIESLETARKTYERLTDIWSDNGIPSEKGLRAAATLAEVPTAFPLEKLVNWSFINEAEKNLLKPTALTDRP